MPDSSISDHIGRIGETFFESLCQKDRLLVGQIIPDRFGIDRFVSFELDPPEELKSYDKRPPPIKCSIQVKTILDTNKNAKISLSVAERLSGDTHPTFICIIRVAADDTVTDMYLVHLLNNNLARILKRLRKESAKKNLKINKSNISFSIKSGESIDLEKGSLKEKIREVIETDMETYAQKKIEQRQTLGYKDDRLVVDVTFDVGSKEELIDGMLGLQKLNLTKFQTSENRFDIKLPFELPHMPDAQKVTMEVSPEPSDRAFLIISNSKGDKIAKIECDLIFPGLPNIALADMKFIARSNLLEAVIGGGSFSLKSTDQLNETAKFTIKEWANSLQAFELLSSGEAEISMESQKGKVLLTGAAALPKMEGYGWSSSALHNLDMLKKLRNEANVTDHPISLSDLMNASKDLEPVYSFFFKPETVGSFSFEMSDVAESVLRDCDQLPVLYVSTLKVGSELYVYGLRLEMNIFPKGEDYQFVSTSMMPLQVISIENQNDSVEKFADSLAKISDISFRIIQFPSAPKEVDQSN